jgi:hypothetical protein
METDFIMSSKRNLEKKEGEEVAQEYKKQDVKDDKDPYKDFQLADRSWLDGLDKRIKCSKCGQPRKYFCYDCYVNLGDEKLVPKIKLPIKVDMY